jgi:hypothetical protein
MIGIAEMLPKNGGLMNRVFIRVPPGLTYGLAATSQIVCKVQTTGNPMGSYAIHGPSWERALPW